MTPDSQITPDWIITDVLRREGGDAFTEPLDDHGGPTHFGITLKTLSEDRGRPATAADVAMLGEAEARAIYRRRYIARPGFDGLAPRLSWLLTDCGVLHGPDRAVKWLQQAVGATIDGNLGPATLAAVTAAGDRQTFLRVCRYRVEFIGRIVTGNHVDADQDGIPDNMEKCAGWLNRAASFLEEAP